MNESELIAALQDDVKESLVAFVERFMAFLAQQPSEKLVSVDWMEITCCSLVSMVAKATFKGWTEHLGALAREVGQSCPQCGRPRKCKTRPGQRMNIRLLGLEVPVPKLYLECGHCGAKGVSITRLLTGLRSGDASVQLKLMAAYCGAEHSYGKASRDLMTHHGQEVERTAVRRMATEVESSAKQFAEEQRRKALGAVGQEAKSKGVERLMMQGDGGSVRTGKLVACEPGDEGFGKKTPKTAKPRRKRETQKREIITLDMRQPGQMEPSALDVVVPCESEPGERSRRMLALAARSGLGDETEVLGLGDLGSNLPASFDEAFCGYKATYSGDWKHVCNYVDAAAGVLEGIDVEAWNRSMRDAIWQRDKKRRDTLLSRAKQHRVKDLPSEQHKCPVDALQSYVCNNWNRMQSARFKAIGVDYVSARAEAQVRERTRKRFEVPGAWLQENLEGKATLRSIIDEGSWHRFSQWYRERSMERFGRQLAERLHDAVQQGRLSQQSVEVFLGEASAPVAAAA